MWRSALRTHLRVLRPQSRQHALDVSSAGALRKKIFFATPSSIFETYREHCPHPDLIHLETLLSVSHSIPDEQSAATSTTDDPWVSIVQQPTLASALDGVNNVLAHHASSGSGTRLRLPTYVVLSVLMKEPTTQAEVFAAYRLAQSQPPRDTTELGPLVMLLSAYWLVKHRMYAPLRGVVLRTLQYKHVLHAYQITLLLRVLGQADTSRELQKMIFILLDVAVKRELDLGVRTYRVLLENPAATSAVARLVEYHMRSRRYAPNLAHTRAFVRIYGRAGRRTMAARHWRRIRAAEYHGPKAEYAMKRKLQSRMLEDYMRSFKNPKKVNLYIKYLLKKTARAMADSEASQSVPPPTLPRPDGISHRLWLQTLRATAETTSVSEEELLAKFNAGKDHIGSPQKTLTAHFMVIKGLVRRRKYLEAVRLLEDVLPMKDQFDGPKLTMAVEALTLANKPTDAFRLLLEFVRNQESVPSVASEHAQDAVEWKSAVYSPRGPLVDTRAINTFMICLFRARRPDVVFYIWDTMPQVFGIEPDSATFAILLKAARYARKFEGALQVAIADFGMGRILPRAREAELNPQRLGRDEAVAGLEALLAPGERRVTGFWRGERAGEVALRVAWQVLVGNWPVLGTFSAPFQAIRRSADGPAASPITDLFHSFAGGSVETQAEMDTARGSARPYDEDGRTFFSIVPDDTAFRALLDLLAAEERAHQVPLVLVWMRYLRVWPSRDTLATALVYWGEVALEGPWVQRVREWRARERGAEDSEYIRGVKWVTKWVGRKNVPRKDETYRALARVRWFRDSQAIGQGE
ncbi:hypothetical protein K466DRAFT_605324 [Polyporus arcularius HHB13444]|uniref:Uncharacterized protein n=1 Tax=Polyporus arcularius HHB13444 TaxID=1314778 RepID=A0A5C3NSD4_9APHY|nr:hypothetical protein K466DRAFT_605324 [Polyporus arcularius HHB13444]